METISAKFGLSCGLSDHSVGIAIPIAASALGATVIEKHFTLDSKDSGPDHASSLEPNQLAEMVTGIRAVEQALGDGVKQPSPSEKANLDICRRSLVTLMPVFAGNVFDEKNLGTKRPGNGISAMYYWDWLGRLAEHDLPEEFLIE